VRKILTFNKILDTIASSDSLTKDSIDVAMRWAQYCEKLFHECQDKPFFTKLENAVAGKISAKLHELGANIIPFKDLKNSSMLVIMTLLKNPLLPKDLFAYTLKVAQGDLETDLLAEIASLCVRVTEYGRKFGSELPEKEVELVSHHLIKLAKASDFMTLKNHLRDRLDYNKGEKWAEFIMKLLLFVNSDKLLNEENLEPVSNITEILTDQLLMLFHCRKELSSNVNQEVLHQICSRDSRFLHC